MCFVIVTGLAHSVVHYGWPWNWRMWHWASRRVTAITSARAVREHSPGMEVNSGGRENGSKGNGKFRQSRPTRPLCCRNMKNKFCKGADPKNLFFKYIFRYLLILLDFHASRLGSQPLHAGRTEQNVLIKQNSNLPLPTLLFTFARHQTFKNAYLTKIIFSLY